jgi:hypothetical protein
MRRLAVLLLAILAAPAASQGAPMQLTLGIWATTYCQSGLVYSVSDPLAAAHDTLIVRTSVDARVYADTGWAEEVLAHETIHRLWFEKDPKARCGHLTPELALALEIDAYCRTIDIPIHYGKAEAVYVRNLTSLVDQFSRWFAYDRIVGAWYARCGYVIDKTIKDTSGVRPR